MSGKEVKTAHYHLPGLYEFYELYSAFFELFRVHREYFFDWCDIASVYGAPADCIWGGGRVGFGMEDTQKVMSLVKEYGISPRLTFSNSLLREEHLSDRRCNELCEIFEESSRSGVRCGIIVHSDLLLEYLKKHYPSFYYISSTTKVLTDPDSLRAELDREDFNYVVPDFRLNNAIEKLATLTKNQRSKLEMLCNECCSLDCTDRAACYENVSRRSLGEDTEHLCTAPCAFEGYRFSRAMSSPAFIGTDDITDIYLPMGIDNFKLEGRGLGSAVILELLLYYMTRPEYRLTVREEIFLDPMPDIF